MASPVITPLEGGLFAVLAVMVLIWFVGVNKLSRRLRERHSDKFDEMGLARLWPQNLMQWLSGYNNSGPVFALFRFLFRSEDVELHDAEVSRRSVFLRRLFCVYLILFLLLIFLIVRPPPRDNTGSRQVAAGATSASQERRNEAYRLHRDKKWTEAIFVYDQLLQNSSRDAYLHYWRGMAHWQLGHTEMALEDFRSVIELEPANFEAYRSADRLLSRQRRWDDILEIWDGYIARVPANAEAYFERGGTNYRKGDLVAARADAAKACELGKAEGCTWAERLKHK